MPKVTDPKAWMGACVKCKGMVWCQWIPMPKDDFVCWNCGPEDIRQWPGGEVYVKEQA